MNYAVNKWERLYPLSHRDLPSALIVEWKIRPAYSCLRMKVVRTLEADRTILIECNLRFRDSAISEWIARPIVAERNAARDLVVSLRAIQS